VEELRRIRGLRGMNQKELALSVGVDPSTLNQIEKGRRAPSVHTLTALARGLDCEVRDLFAPGYTPPARPPGRKAVAVS